MSDLFSPKYAEVLSKMFVVFSLKNSDPRRRKEPKRCNVLSFISHLECGGWGWDWWLCKPVKSQALLLLTDSHLIYGGWKSDHSHSLVMELWHRERWRKRCHILQLAKVTHVFNSIQDAFCKTVHIVSSIGIWSLTSFLWGVTTVNLELCGNQEELKYLKSYRITLLHYRRFYKRI